MDSFNHASMDSFMHSSMDLTASGEVRSDPIRRSDQEKSGLRDAMTWIFTLSQNGYGTSEILIQRICNINKIYEKYGD